MIGAVRVLRVTNALFFFATVVNISLIQTMHEFPVLPFHWKKKYPLNIKMDAKKVEQKFKQRRILEQSQMRARELRRTVVQKSQEGEAGKSGVPMELQLWSPMSSLKYFPRWSHASDHSRRGKWSAKKLCSSGETWRISNDGCCK